MRTRWPWRTLAQSCGLLPSLPWRSFRGNVRLHWCARVHDHDYDCGCVRGRDHDCGRGLHGCVHGCVHVRVHVHGRGHDHDRGQVQQQDYVKERRQKGNFFVS